MLIWLVLGIKNSILYKIYALQNEAYHDLNKSQDTACSLIVNKWIWDDK